MLTSFFRNGSVAAKVGDGLVKRHERTGKPVRDMLQKSNQAQGAQILHMYVLFPFLHYYDSVFPQLSFHLCIFLFLPWIV